MSRLLLLFASTTEADAGFVLKGPAVAAVVVAVNGFVGAGFWFCRISPGHLVVVVVSVVNK